MSEYVVCNQFWLDVCAVVKNKQSSDEYRFKVEINCGPQKTLSNNNDRG